MSPPNFECNAVRGKSFRIQCGIPSTEKFIGEIANFEVSARFNLEDTVRVYVPTVPPMGNFHGSNPTNKCKS